MMATKTAVPRFKSEKEEAEWWDAHADVITALFLKAKKEGRIKRLPVELAEKRGLPCQAYIKGLLHQVLERERTMG